MTPLANLKHKRNHSASFRIQNSNRLLCYLVEMVRRRSLSPVRRSRPLRHTGGRLDEPMELYTRDSSTTGSASTTMPSSCSTSCTNATQRQHVTAGEAKSPLPEVTNPLASAQVDGKSSPTASQEPECHRRRMAHIRSQPNVLLTPDQVAVSRRLCQHKRLAMHLEESDEEHELDQKEDNQLQDLKENHHKPHAQLHEFLIQVVDEDVLLRSQENLVRLVDLAQTAVMASNSQQHLSIAMARKALRYRGQMGHHRQQMTHLL